MNKDKAILHYRVAMSILKKWLDEGFITEDEFMKIETLIAGKYGLPKDSIYR